MISSLTFFWREYLRVRENTIAYFNGDIELAKSKRWNRFYRMFKNSGEIVFCDNIKDILYFRTNDNVMFKTKSNSGIAIEVFVHKVYSLPPQISNKKFIVFDFGMNKAYATLFFANMKNCECVHAFEIDSDTFNYAQENISFNPDIENKINIYQYGVWNEDSEIEICNDDNDGHTAVRVVKSHVTPISVKKSHVRKASTVMTEILEGVNENIFKVVKIDIEGSEYVVFEDLYKNGLLKQVDFIIGEYHDGFEKLEPYFKDFVCLQKRSLELKGVGVFTYIRKDLYEIPMKTIFHPR